MKKEIKRKIIQTVITIFTFWILDFALHLTGVGETNYYYLSKFGNAILFSLIWFFIFAYKSHWRKILFSFIFGTWVSFYYLISSYSGLVQILGISARYTSPPFVIAGIFLSPVLWWVTHSVGFYLGLEISSLLEKSK